jgi:hypothetical protein
LRLLFNFTLNYAFRGLKLNGTPQLLVYADAMDILGDNIDTIKETETLIDTSKEVGQEVNAKKTK